MKIALLGYGRMGHMIEELVQASDEDQIVLKVDQDNSNQITTAQLAEADVAIDFSTPDSAVTNIKRAIAAGLPVASGTTGWLEQWEEVTQFCRQREGAFLYASNFSIGVNLFFAINQRLSELMNDHPYDITIDETHHIHKQDAPSGTAITLAEQILKNVKRKEKWVLENATTDKELLILAHRKDEVPGTHVVRYDSPIDSIEIKHEAHGRVGFASGALTAARWLIGRQGIFTMQDVLGI